MASTTDTQTEITLKGSVDIVSEFFFTAINSILYQRGKCVLCTTETISLDGIGDWVGRRNFGTLHPLLRHVLASKCGRRRVV